jgi:NAD(P)-dependent dehydrogenase (short-subunit alcohol dehydrogenase family)
MARHSPHFNEQAEMTITMQGKVCLVTGGTNGIGKSTALALAKMGANVVIVGRDAAKTTRVVEEIRAASGNQQVESLLADLSSQQDIRRLAREFNSRYSSLQVLLNNAGAIIFQRRLSVDGIEMTFALNHLAYFLLTNLLLDTLRASAPARIINVASNAHKAGSIDFDNLQGEGRSARMKIYNNSKLANILFTAELAYRLEGTGVTANALHPGLVATGIANSNGKVVAALYGRFMPLIARSPEKGAETPIYLATSPEVEGVTGKYFFDCKVKAPAAHALDMAVARKLWDVSAEMVHLGEAMPVKA